VDQTAQNFAVPFSWFKKKKICVHAHVLASNEWLRLAR